MRDLKSGIEPESRHVATYTLDASGLTCPMHVLMCKAQLVRMEVGEELRFVGTDRGCLFEIPLLVRYSGCEMIEQCSSGGRHQFRIRRRHQRGGSRAVRSPLRRRARGSLGAALAWLGGQPPAAGTA